MSLSACGNTSIYNINKKFETNTTETEKEYLSSVKDFGDLIDIVGHPYQMTCFSKLDMDNGIQVDDGSGFDGANFWFGYNFDEKSGNSLYENNNILSNYTSSVPTSIEIECYDNKESINSIEIYYDSLSAYYDIISGFSRQYPDQSIQTNNDQTAPNWTFYMKNSFNKLITCSIQLYSSGDSMIILEWNNT